MENKIIADIFNEIAELLSVDERPTSKFEVRAYQKAALTISTLQEPIEDVYAKGGLKALMELPGVGKSIAGHIEEYLKTHRIEKYDELKKKYPIDMAALTSIQGMGAKKAITLYRRLGIRNIDDLKKALSSHRIRKLEGFGEKSEEMIQKGLTLMESSGGRMLLGDALPVAEEIVRKLKESGLAREAMVAGSARRMRETVGDIDILVISGKQKEVMDFFTALPSVDTVLVSGPTKTSVHLKMGLNCDLRVIEPESFGAAVQYFTGSRDHNIQVRTIAVNKGYKLNEYGLFDKKGVNIGGIKEEGIYEALGMQWMPPEMREARGEVQLAIKHKIPDLVKLKDLNGDLHTHTKETDGANTLEEMANEAMRLGHEYIATTNHTKSLYIARGMNDDQFVKYFKQVDKLNEKLKGKLTILKGAEVDILKDGSLDLRDSTLEYMDCVVGAIHSSFKLDKKEMTKRIIAALDSGLIHVLAHPTGREINERQAYEVDLEAVAETAARNKVALEINSFPNRLDLNDTNIMRVSGYNVLFSIDSDAHRTANLSFLRYGIGTARRGWLTKDRIINAKPLKELLKYLKK